jgi:hypothetical protein
MEQQWDLRGFTKLMPPLRSVTLYLPKKRSLNHLTVRLVGRQDISWGDSRPYESSICLDKEVALFSGKDEVVLDKGEHQFSFSIIVPSSTPTCERCQWGRVRHTVVAKAKGLGQLGGDVLSTEKPLFLIVNVSVTRLSARRVRSFADPFSFRSLEVQAPRSHRRYSTTGSRECSTTLG